MIGEEIGSYRILSQLGTGGMGMVYLAEHRHLQRRAAVKVLLPDFLERPDLLARFFAEARATSRLDHPGIVRIFDCEVDGQGRPYIVTEFLRGETLQQLLARQKRLPVEEVLRLGRAMAEALGAAHEKGIVHRDVKPDNVFVMRPGEFPVKLVDFGIAKLAESHAKGKGLTETGMLLGTPAYMSPEQGRGSSSVDHRADIYALGCVLYEMATGQLPFLHEGVGELVYAHLTQEPKLAHEVETSLPQPLSELLAAMMRKDPDERPGTMAAVVAWIESLERLAAPVTAHARVPIAIATFNDASAPVALPAPAALDIPATRESPKPPPEPPAAPVTQSGHAPAAVATETTERLSPFRRRGRTTRATLAAPEPPLGADLLVADLAVGFGIFALLLVQIGVFDVTRPLARPAAAPPPPPPVVVKAPPRPALARSAPLPAETAIESDPPGAEICDAETRRLLEHTFPGARAPRTKENQSYLVRRAGFRPETVTAGPDPREVIRVVLAPLPPGEPAPAPCLDDGAPVQP